jgi:hypothetical protein
MPDICGEIAHGVLFKMATDQGFPFAHLITQVSVGFFIQAA